MSSKASQPNTEHSPMSAPISALMASTEQVAGDLTPVQFENLLLHTLGHCNRLSRNTEITSREVAMGKMVNYCIRMLHSHGWVPRTVVRAMVHIEAGTERSIKGVLHQSMREKRDEGRARRAMISSGGAGTEMPEGWTISDVETLNTGTKIRRIFTLEGMEIIAVQPPEAGKSASEPAAIAATPREIGNVNGEASTVDDEAK